MSLTHLKQFVPTFEHSIDADRTSGQYGSDVMVGADLFAILNLHCPFEGNAEATGGVRLCQPARQFAWKLRCSRQVLLGGIFLSS